MASSLRQQRVADRIQAEISELLQQELDDPRLTLVTVTRVLIDRELAYANVFVSTVGDAARQQEVLQALNHAKGFIRREIGRRVRLRATPEIIFNWDPGLEKAEAMGQLLDRLRADEGLPPAPPATETKPDDE